MTLGTSKNSVVLRIAETDIRIICIDSPRHRRLAIGRNYRVASNEGWSLQFVFHGTLNLLTTFPMSWSTIVLAPARLAILRAEVSPTTGLNEITMEKREIHGKTVYIFESHNIALSAWAGIKAEQDENLIC